MPPGPIRALRFVHTAIREQAALVEREVAALSEPAAAAALADAVGVLTDAVRVHVKGEDEGYFAPVAERAPDLVETFAFDHDSEASRLDALDDLVRSCRSEDDLAALYRAAVAVREHLDHHMLKEEEILWPRTEALFSPPEQAAFVQAILAVIPQEAFPALLPWIVALNPPDEGEAYLRMLKQVQPPEAFAMTRQWVRQGIPDALWSDLVGRMPELAAG